MIVKFPMLNTVQSLANGVLDLLYPPKCVGCGDIQRLYICDDCLRSITYLEPPLCEKCGLPIEEGECLECSRTRFAFAGARAVGVYEGVLREAIHELKYSGSTVIAAELGSMLSQMLSNCREFAPNVSVVIPVPIHSSRRRERGFNQSELLGRYAANHLNIPMESRVLVRTQYSRPQVELPVNARRENVRGVFQVIDESRVYGKRVLLVDDVLTTGSTTHEASKVLRSAGAEAVYVLTLARSLLARFLW